MNTAYITHSCRPVQGLVAFVRDAGMSVGCEQLDRAEDPTHPGEGSA